MAREIYLTGNERFFEDDEIIVSKTDLKGRITYANDVFLRIAGYKEKEIFGQPHSIIRHPDMPRAVFSLLWSTISKKKEIFAYVINRCKNGDHYWVNAHVTPSFNANGEIISYHSNRRVPDQQIIKKHIIPLYQELLKIEQSTSNKKQGMQDAEQRLLQILEQNNIEYDEFIATLAA